MPDKMFFLLSAPSAIDSDSEEDEPPFYLASESAGRSKSASRPSHNLSLLSLTVIIGKGRLQARTDKKVRRQYISLYEDSTL